MFPTCQKTPLSEHLWIEAVKRTALIMAWNLSKRTFSEKNAFRNSHTSVFFGIFVSCGLIKEHSLILCSLIWSDDCISSFPGKKSFIENRRKISRVFPFPREIYQNWRTCDCCPVQRKYGQDWGVFGQFWRNVSILFFYDFVSDFGWELYKTFISFSKLKPVEDDFSRVLILFT